MNALYNYLIRLLSPPGMSNESKSYLQFIVFHSSNMTEAHSNIWSLSQSQVYLTNSYFSLGCVTFKTLELFV